MLMDIQVVHIARERLSTCTQPGPVSEAQPVTALGYYKPCFLCNREFARGTLPSEFTWYVDL